MRSATRLFIIPFVFTAVVLCQAPIRVTRNVEVTAEEEKVRDKHGYEAIRDLHREMDDDHSGSIDRNESTGFMKEDMHMRGTERTRRENKFHGDDDAITVDDLWEAWFESAERNWNNEKLVEWLTIDVNLPNVAEVAKKRKYDGKVLPRLATQNADFLSREMGIKSSVHRQKLRLNALDVVLFGYRDNNNKLKDILLAFLALLLTSIIILYVRQKQKAQETVNELSTRLTELKSMESEFEAQKLLNDERSKRSTADGAVSQTEMENLRYQLLEAERRLEENTAGTGNAPFALQPLLRKTYENEMAFLEKQRQDCFKEMKDAIEMVDRLQKKQGSVLSSLKLATGAASTSDQVDSKIFALKSRMEKIHGLTRETQERWMQIESLSGFPILYMDETVPMHNSNSSSHFYNNSQSGESSMSSSVSMSNGNNIRPKLSTINVKKVSTSSSSLPQRAKAPPISSGNGSIVYSSNDIDEDEEKTSRTTATIAFQRIDGKSEDSSSIGTTTSSTLVEIKEKEKKKRSILPKIFRKTTSKSSLFGTNSSVSSQ